MKALIQLAPIAVGLVAFAGAVAFTLPRNATLGAWLIAGFLVAHGLVHIMFAAPPPAAANTPGAEFAFDPNRSWLVTTGSLSVGSVRAIVLVLVVATVIGYALAAAATAGILVPGSWWWALVLGSTGSSGLLMLVGLSPGLALGIAVDIALFGIVLSRLWSPVNTT